MIKPSHFELDTKQGSFYKIADILKEYQLSDNEAKLLEKLEVL